MRVMTDSASRRSGWWERRRRASGTRSDGRPARGCTPRARPRRPVEDVFGEALTRGTAAGRALVPARQGPPPSSDGRRSRRRWPRLPGHAGSAARSCGQIAHPDCV